MAEYRVYALNEAGRVVNGRDIQCSSDEEARVRARGMLDSVAGIEIWEGTRRVDQISPDPGRHDDQ